MNEEQLMMENIKLVQYIARRYERIAHVPYDDCFQEGCIGLLRAIREYKEDGKAKFSGFAGMHIQWAIAYSIKNKHLIFTPSHITDIATMIRKRELQDEPVAHIAKVINKKESDVKKALQHLQLESFSLDKKYYNKNGESTTVHDYLGYEQDVTSNILLDRILEYVPVIYHDALRLYVEGYSNEQIAKKLNMTVKQARNKVMIGKARARDHKEEFLRELQII